MSIIPYKAKNKRLMILPSGKLKDVSISSRTYLISLSVKKESNLSKALEDCEREKIELQKTIELGSDKVLRERVKHQEIMINEHRLYCPLVYAEIMFTGCIAKRKREECSRLCVTANKFTGNRSW